MSSARRVAAELLEAVDERDAYANLALPELLREARLSPRDAGFATELGYGTLRMRGFVDAILALVVPRSFESLDAPVRRLLELGTYQLVVLGTEPHAAVSETVTLSRRMGVGGASGFINANLRRISERSAEDWRALIAERYSEIDARAALTSHPTWVIDELERALERAGRSGELEVLLAADNVSPRVNLVSLPGIGPGPSVIGEPNRYSPIGAQSPLGNPAKLTAQPGVRVQDEGSQLAALALSRVRPVAAEERWLDLCAGPGGKAAVLAAEALTGGASLTANEVSAHRAELVRGALRDVPGRVEVLTLDGRSLRDREATFDRILLDAPCSGLGALRRRPESRWRKQPDDIAQLRALQLELLRAALVALTPGGVLAYVTCSPVVAETSDVLAEVLDGSVSLLDTAAVLDGIAREPLDAALSIPGSNGTAVQLWPHRHASDAMFIALLTRT